MINLFFPQWPSDPPDEKDNDDGFALSNWGNVAHVKVSLYENEASYPLAHQRARKKFIDISKALPEYINKSKIIGKKRIVLFTSVQIEYNVKIIADSYAVSSYYDNFKGD
jgi:hypothetical protein